MELNVRFPQMVTLGVTCKHLATRDVRRKWLSRGGAGAGGLCQDKGRRQPACGETALVDGQEVVTGHRSPASTVTRPKGFV